MDKAERLEEPEQDPGVPRTEITDNSFDNPCNRPFLRKLCCDELPFSTLSASVSPVFCFRRLGGRGEKRGRRERDRKLHQCKLAAVICSLTVPLVPTPFPLCVCDSHVSEC